MLITYHGHSEFLLESADGYRLLTDPFDSHVGYPIQPVRADACLVSHGHGDHSYTEKLTGQPVILNQPGETRLAIHTKVCSMSGWHDNANGAKRGSTLLTVIEMDGLRIGHLGDLGCMPDEKQTEFLKDLDLLLIPVGGYYTIDGETAANIVRLIQPHTVIPMHYTTQYNRDWPITDATPFLTAMDLENVTPMPLMRVTRGDISCLPSVCVLLPNFCD